MKTRRLPGGQIKEVGVFLMKNRVNFRSQSGMKSHGAVSLCERLNQHFALCAFFSTHSAFSQINNQDVLPPLPVRPELSSWPVCDSCCCGRLLNDTEFCSIRGPADVWGLLSTRREAGGRSPLSYWTQTLVYRRSWSSLINNKVNSPLTPVDLVSFLAFNRIC